jgi:glycyl-tRNA synthetase
MITFQELIRRLALFWEEQGCVIQQGYDLEMGAGTFNPATFLRSLGPEPYKTAYVEPSRRPSDGRYGKNPNRLHLFHQYQVILKPSPLNVQEMYLKSLEAIGLNLQEHDIRFVHDDWESPTQGAWGLGWEVWVDGMEATQFTYFQMIGSQPLKPIPVELTYGVERLAMYIQGVDNFLDIQWNDTLTFKELSYKNEVEWSTYNFEEANVEMWKRHFDDFEKEAKDLIARHLPLPAYDFVIKASHAFNILEARGVISVTERTGYITRIRDLARLIAAEYIASREQIGFPLLTKKEPIKEHPLPPLPTSFDPNKKETFLLEIGSEELPATFIPIGLRNLETQLTNLLKKEGLSFDTIKLFATPRRLAAQIIGLAEGTANKTIERRGPKMDVAFLTNGTITPQGEGFLKSVGLASITRHDLEEGKINGLSTQNDYLFARVSGEGRSTAAILSSAIANLITDLDFPKKMRWGDLDISYPRPIHWIISLFGDRIIPCCLGGVVGDNHTFGHRQRCSKKVLVKHANDYVETLRSVSVLVDREERKRMILTQLNVIEQGLQVHSLETDRVLKEVLDMCEWPELTTAEFDPKFLAAPKEVLVSEMVEHQKYFPLADSTGTLKNIFVITADNTPSDLIRKGNQKVLSARLSDGVFLYEQDLKSPLENFNEKLKHMTFQKELGSVLDKVMRITEHAKSINQELAIADETKCAQAALLCKADLATALVKEFPNLQGFVGKIYALKQNLDHEVATALEEHWFPTSEHGELPKTACGIILSLSDKVDNFLGYFSVGLKPSSSSDPYGLRRQGFGLLKILIDNQLSINLNTLLEVCSQHFPKPGNSETFQDILDFLTARAKSVFEGYGFKKDEIDACLQGHLIDPYDQLCKLQALSEFRSSGDMFLKLFEVYKRAKGQLKLQSLIPFNPQLATEPAEKELIQALHSLEKDWKTTLREKNYIKAFHMMATLQPPLANLFDTLRILCEDTKIKDNRIALLHKVFAYFEELLDFGKIQQ